MVDILEKDFQNNLLKMLRELKEDVGKENKQIKQQYKTMYDQNKEGTSKKKPKEIVELKSTITKMQNLLEDFTGRAE